MPWYRHFDWRAIAAPLHQAVLLSLQITDRVGDPNAGDHQRDQDHKGDQVHEHAVAIIDRPVVFLFEPRKIVEIIFGQPRCLSQGGLPRRARLKPEYLAEWAGLAPIGPLYDRF